jgi:activating signal cointegrator complex subunit 3
LPNYIDVSNFLRVNPKYGLFYFDSRFRPVPLIQTFIGCKSVNKVQVQKDMDEVCFDKVCKQVQRNNQCMVFVHTRHGTLKTANYIRDEAIKAGLLNLFITPVDFYQKKLIESVRNKPLQTLMFDGIGIHHAGLLRKLH